MSRPPASRTRLVAVACAGLVLLAGPVLLAGCGTSHTPATGLLGGLQVTPGGGASAPAATPTGASPGSPADPTSTATPGQPTPGQPTPGQLTGSAGQPSTTPSAGTAYPPDYAAAILAAWAAHNLVSLTLLTDLLDAQQLLGIGDPDRHWTAVTYHGGTAGSTYSAFSNASGDWLVLRLDNADLLGHLFHAGRLDEWDPISYPGSASAYAKEFVDGWIDGNQARMAKLSSAAVTASFLGRTAPDPGYALGSPQPSGGHVTVEITEASVPLDATITIATASLGHAHAIDGCLPACT